MLGLGINDQVDGDGGGGRCEDPSRIKKKNSILCVWLFRPRAAEILIEIQSFKKKDKPEKVKGS